MMTHKTTNAGPVSAHDYPPGQASALRLWVALNRALSAVAVHDRAQIEGWGLTPGEFAVLEVLYHKGPLLLGEVGRKVLASSGGVTYLVDKLVKRGLVERQACPSDRRASYAALTDEGRRSMTEIFPQHAVMLDRALGGLDEDERTQAIRLLKKAGLHAEALSE